MSELFTCLPSFATDYSGFISLMHGLGGMMIVHDPSGCLGNYTNTDEPRWYHDPQPVYSSTMGELEAVVGDTSIVIEKATKEINRRKPPFVCILGTPVPALTGCDVNLIADEIENNTNVRCFGIETNGFKFYDDGIEKAMNLILNEFMIDTAEKVSGRVNVLGMTPLDYSIYGEKEKIEQYLASKGLHVGAFIGMGNDLLAIKNAKSAELNLVMSAVALPVARKMKRDCGIDYWVGPPCSIQAAKKLVKDISFQKLLIIGEQLCANSLRNAVEQLHPGIEIVVATFFKFDEEVSRRGDIKLHSENDLVLFLKSGEFDAVIADPLIEPLCIKGQHFIPCVHPAVSSKLCWRDTILYSI